MTHVRPLQILLLCDEIPGSAETISAHIQALVGDTGHHVHRLNPRPARHLFVPDLDEFDVVILHYSLYALFESYLPLRFKDALRSFTGLKVQFIQDDYRDVTDFAGLMADLGIDLLFTLVPEDSIKDIWRRYPALDRMEIRTTLAGFVPDRFVTADVPKIAERAIHIAYRGRPLPYWLGALSQEKIQIAERFTELAKPLDLRCDISWREEDRIYGDGWLEFLKSTKAVLGTESGASITDFDGDAQRVTEEYLAQRPDASFEEVQSQVLEPFEGNVKMNIISPRIFEAVATRTAMVLFPGEYGGVLRAHDHYVPLRKDFSNFPEVVRALRDDVYLQDLADRSYEEIALSGRYSYAKFARRIGEILTEAWEALPAERRRSGPGHRHLVRAKLSAARALDPVNPLLGRHIHNLLPRLPEPPVIQTRRILRWLIITAACIVNPTGRALLRRVLRGPASDRGIALRAALTAGALAALWRGVPALGFEDAGSILVLAHPEASRPPAPEQPATVRDALLSGSVSTIRWLFPESWYVRSLGVFGNEMIFSPGASFLKALADEFVGQMEPGASRADSQ